jgi:anti-sigma factor ChrR (cupin superfamily)
MVAAAASNAPTAFTPASIHWMPGTGDMKGLQVAMLEGNPAKPGPWTIRLKLPAGTVFPAHHHPDTERVTIISGSLGFGVGPKFNASKLTTFPAGTYAIIPAGVPHFVSTTGGCVIQISGNKPFAMMMEKESGGM